MSHCLPPSVTCHAVAACRTQGHLGSCPHSSGRRSSRSRHARYPGSLQWTTAAKDNCRTTQAPAMQSPGTTVATPVPCEQSFTQHAVNQHHTHSPCAARTADGAALHGCRTRCASLGCHASSLSLFWQCRHTVRACPHTDSHRGWNRCNTKCDTHTHRVTPHIDATSYQRLSANFQPGASAF